MRRRLGILYLVNDIYTGLNMLKRARVDGELREGYVVEAKAKGHKIIMDLPPPLGKNLGPTPVDLMLASLIGCIGIVARYHAKNFGIEIRSLKVIVEAEYDTAGFEGKDVKAGMHRVEARVIVDSPNDINELRKFFKFVEEHCPVGDTLASNTPISLTIEKMKSK